MKFKLYPFLVAFSLLVIAVHCTDDATKFHIDPLDDAKLNELMSKAESHEFQAEVDKMMKLIINSLYKNKEIFLRELISNASDALDKIRLLSLQDADKLKDNPNLEIHVKADKEKKQLIIADSGIGMTKEELLKNLGTIAKSGTAEFLSKFQGAKSEKETSDLIGQFGVGFYSAFLVADRVTVVTKATDDDQYIWESDASKFSLTKDPRGNTLKRGTEIILHLKDEAQDYLKEATLKDIAKRYSQFINFPIYLWESETKMIDAEETPEEVKKDGEEKDDVVVEEEKKKEEPKKVEKTTWDWKQVNTQKPIWSRSPSDVTEEEYKEFFQVVADKSYEKELAHIHFKAEGDVSFNALLFIPEEVFGDMFTQGAARAKAILRLYVRRVFITDELEEMLPRYLSFIRGVIDSEDLPLNVSRETLQQSKLLKLIRKKLVRKVIEMISKMEKETFAKFWKKFAVNIKVGIMEDQSNMMRLSKLLRFRTSTTSGDELSSLEDYVKRMKEKQKEIFYVTGTSVQSAKQSPFVERALKMGYEVIYMSDPMDEHMMTALKEFDGKKMQNLAKEGIEFIETEESKAEFESLKVQFEPLLKWLKEDALKDQIAKAELSKRLSDSPSALVAGEHEWSGNMERLMTAQAYTNSEDPTRNYQMNLKKTLDLNPRHPIVKELKAIVAQNPADPVARDVALMLFDTAALRSGFQIKDSVEFAKRIERVMRKNLDISEDESSEEEQNLPKLATNAKTEEPTEEHHDSPSKDEL